jgi:CRP-like cAMP-binding protein
MSVPARPENRLLAALPSDAYSIIEPQLERRSLEHGHVLHKPGETIRDLYFPLGCLISVTVTMRNDRTVETGVVGRRDVVGINAFMGGRETTHTEYVVQVPGDAVRVPADAMREEFDRNRDLRAVLLKYTQAMIAQISQNVACNRVHSVEQRYARWLLETRDRVASDDLELTHAFIAEMLGVRRAGVTEVSGKFEGQGIIETRRNHTVIVNVPALEGAACECYQVVQAEYDRLLGPSGS